MTPIASSFSAAPLALFLPHGYCIAWRPGLLALHVISDALIVLAYYSIPLTLLYFLYRRPMFGYNWVLGMFAGFILTCGTTHLLAIVTLWEPIYWAEGWLKAGTAAISLFTALLIWPLVPKALALPAPGQLQATNDELRAEVDQRRRVEAELRDFQGQLEQTVGRRTADLERVQAGLQQEIAERTRIDRFKNELVAMVSQELRTPLTSIGGSLHLLTTDDSISPQDRHELSEVALRNTERMIRLVNDLLDINRIESGRLSYTFEALSLRALAQSATIATMSNARQHGVNLLLDVEDGPLIVNGDAERLVQALTHLISNGVQHTPRGASVQVSVKRNGAAVKVMVSDSGPRISGEPGERLLERLERAPDSRLAADGGAGLGLSIAQAIVQAHGGHIAVQSPPDGQTSFTFELPEHGDALGLAERLFARERTSEE